MSDSDVQKAEQEVVDVLPKLADPAGLSPDALMEMRASILVHREQRRAIERELADGGPADPVRKGILEWLVARSAQAAATLASATNLSAVFARAKSLEECRRSSEALDAIASAKFGRESVAPVLVSLDALARLRRFDELTERIQALENEWKDRGDLFYYKGLLAENDGEYEQAEDLYVKALTMDEGNTRALFRFAYRLDMRGEDQMAMEFYERCTRAHPPHINAFMNLGVMYEDAGRYEDAIECFRKVLQFEPNHSRARLFLKDAEASLDMYYDEDEEKKEDRLNQILRIPVTDFELSVRSRNCLEKMNLRTLGDLTKMSEAELLSFKNFGETSLAEIKEILASKGLRLGMAREFESDVASDPRARRQRADHGSGDVMSRPISELELSVRSRRAMAVLGIQTIGDLTERSEDELKAVKNFGTTSLNEVKRKLQEYSLSLKA